MRLMRPVINNQIKVGRMTQYFLLVFFGIGITHNDGDPWIFELQHCAGWVYVTAHNPFGIWEKFAPDFQRPPILDSNLQHSNRTITIS